MVSLLTFYYHGGTYSAVLSLPLILCWYLSSEFGFRFVDDISADMNMNFFGFCATHLLTVRHGIFVLFVLC